MTIHQTQLGRLLYDDEAGTLTFELRATAPPAPPGTAGSWYPQAGVLLLTVPAPKKVAATPPTALLVPTEGTAVSYEFVNGAWRPKV